MGVYLSSRARIDFNMILNVRQSLWRNQGGPAIYLPYVRRADVVCSCFDLFISFDVFVQLWSPSEHGDSIGANQTIEPLCSLFFLHGDSDRHRHPRHTARPTFMFKSHDRVLE